MIKSCLFGITNLLGTQKFQIVFFSKHPPSKRGHFGMTRKKTILFPRLQPSFSHQMYIVMGASFDEQLNVVGAKIKYKKILRKNFQLILSKNANLSLR